MKIALISWFWLLLQPNDATVYPTIKELPYPDSRSQPTDLIATSTGGFIATFDGSLVFISEDLEVLDLELRAGTSKDSGVAANGNSSVLYCFNDGKCFYLVDMQILDMDIDYKAATAGVAISTSIVDDTCYIASSANTTENKVTIRISKYKIACMYFLQDQERFEKMITNRTFISREFFVNFYDDLYVYFIAIDTFSPLREKKITLMRSCRDDNNTATNDLSSMFEIELDCGTLNTNAKLISFSQLNDTFVLGVRGVEGGENFYVFSVADINNNTRRAYDQCCEGNYHFQLPWSGTNSTCIGFMISSDVS